MTIQHPSFSNIPENRVIIFDTTLRDGEQSPGFSMNLDKKLRMARALENLGVDVIEAGFPVASPGDFEAVNAIAKATEDVVVCALARSGGLRDIAAAGEAIAPARRKRIHNFISTSPLHMKYKLRMTPETVLELIVSGNRASRQLTDDVQWSAEDGARTEIDFLCRCVEVAIRNGATTINIPDTVGFSTREEIAPIFETLRQRVPDAEKVIFSTHNHNDLGLGVANSLAALMSGARQIECTINGIGERAGNAALEELVMAIRTRHDKLPFTHKVHTPSLLSVSRLLTGITGFDVQSNKAIVGRNAFAHESGIHQDGILKNAATYEIMTPESASWTKSILVLGKHSGRAAFRDKVASLGYTLSDAEIEHAFVRFKTLADQKKSVFDDDIIALIDEENHLDAAIQFDAIKVQSGSERDAWVELTLIVSGAPKKSPSRVMDLLTRPSRRLR